MTLLLLPDNPTGYALDPRTGFWSVVVPEGSTNLITNPSVELTLNGYTTEQSAIVRTSAKAARGLYSLQVTPNGAGTVGGIYYALPLTVGGTYTFSADVWAPYGQVLTMRITTNTLTVLSVREIVGTGRWERISVSCAVAATVVHLLYLRTTDAFDDRVFYTDGWQLEAKPYPTTYVDGDQVGMVRVPWFRDYYWTGPAHGSTSVRHARSRSGGRVANLRDECFFQTTHIIGLGMANREHRSVLLGHGVSLYEGSTAPPREFTITGVIYGADFRQLQRRRRALVDLLRHDLVYPEQPVLLRYRPADASGMAYGATLEIPCVLVEGLSGNSDNYFQESIALNFRAYGDSNPRALDHASVSISPGISWTNRSGVFHRDTDGQWAGLGDGASTGTIVYAVLFDADGDVIAGGDFTAISGVAAKRIARWDGSAWDEIGNGFNGTVRDLALGSDGYLYACGDFTFDGIGTPMPRIARWNGTFWFIVGAGLNNTAYEMFPYANYIYIAGSFTDVAGVATSDYLVRWNISTGAYETLATGFDTTVTSVVVVGDIVYAGGFFTVGNPVAPAAMAHIAYRHRDPTSGTYNWEQVGSGLNDTVTAMALGPDGFLYVGGDFTADGDGNALSHLVRWNGVSFEEVGGGLNLAPERLFFDEQGSLWAMGGFTIAGDDNSFQYLAIWNGSTWQYGDPSVDGIVYDADIRGGQLVIGAEITDGVITAGDMTVVANEGDAATRPSFIIEGPGSLKHILNTATNADLRFSDLSLAVGETAILDLDGLPRMWSNLRSDLLHAFLLPTSNPADWRLLPGDNEVVAQSSVASITLKYARRYHTIDAAEEL